MAKANLEIVISALNMASKDLKQLQGELGDVGKAGTKTEGVFNSLKDNWKQVGAASIAVTAALFAMKKGFDFAKEGAMLARLEDSGSSLAASYGANMDTMLAALQRTSQGTVAETDLILSANRAMMLGVTADADQMANLLEVAALRGRAMGLSTQQAFNDIVTGIGRMSPLILDNLGIVTNMEARVREYADANGIAAESVDDATKKQILLQQVLEDGNAQLKEHGGLVFDTAAAYEKFGAQSEDALNRFKMAAGEAFEPLVGSLADGLEAMNRYQDALDQLGPSYITINERVYQLIGGQLVLVENLQELIANQRISNHETERAAMLQGLLYPELLSTAAGFDELGDSAGGAADKVSAFWAQFKPNVLNDLMGNIEALAFDSAGGQIIAGLKTGVDTALASNAITKDQANAYYKELVVGALQVEIAMGNLTYVEAARKLKEAFNTPLQDGIQLLKTFELAALELASKNFTFWMDVNAPGWFIQLMTSGGVNNWSDPFGGMTPVNPTGASQPGAPKRPPGARTVIERDAAGGVLGRMGTGLVEVGEEGSEGIYWDPLLGQWVVVPHEEWMDAKKKGVHPAVGFAAGGVLPKGGATPEGLTGGAGRWRAVDTGTRHFPSMRINMREWGIGGAGPPGANATPWLRASDRPSGGGGGDAAGQQAAIQTAAQSAASGVGATIATQASQASAQAIAQASKDAQRSAQDTRRILEEIARNMLKRGDLKREFADALAES